MRTDRATKGPKYKSQGEMHLKNVGPLSLTSLSSVRRLECSPEDQDSHYPSSQFFLLEFHS